MYIIQSSDKRKEQLAHAIILLQSNSHQQPDSTQPCQQASLSTFSGRQPYNLRHLSQKHSTYDNSREEQTCMVPAAAAISLLQAVQTQASRRWASRLP